MDLSRGPANLERLCLRNRDYQLRQRLDRYRGSLTCPYKLGPEAEDAGFMRWLGCCNLADRAENRLREAPVPSLLLQPTRQRRRLPNPGDQRRAVDRVAFIDVEIPGVFAL